MQLDGCSAHFSRNVREQLDLEYQQGWIRRGSLFPWQPRSPNLTCLHFYLWDIVYQTPPTKRYDIHSISDQKLKLHIWPPGTYNLK